LVKTKEGRVGFEFEARAPKKTAAQEPGPATVYKPRPGRAVKAEAPAATAKTPKAPKTPAKKAAATKRKKS
jgi:DNA topoisomerase-3